MYVVKRDGSKAEVRMDKITNRVKALCGGLNPDYIDPLKVSTKVVQGLYSGVSTRELDALAAEVCAWPAGGVLSSSLFSSPALNAPLPPPPPPPLPLPPGAYSSTYHPDWSVLAARIVVSDLHKQTEEKFSVNAKRLFDFKHPKTGKPAPLIADDVAKIIETHAERLDACINYKRDFECVVLQARPPPPPLPAPPSFPPPLTRRAHPPLSPSSPPPQLRLFWLQDAGEVVPASRQRRGGGAPPADVPARGGGHPQGGH
jgi:hypothetical protein